MCQNLLSKFLWVPVDMTPAGVCSQPSTAVCITCVKLGPGYGVSTGEKGILISNLPYSSPKSALQLLGAHSANLGWVWGSQVTPSPIRENTWKFSARKPWTFHCVWDREKEKGDQENPCPCAWGGQTAALEEALQDSARLKVRSGFALLWFKRLSLQTNKDLTES